MNPKVFVSYASEDRDTFVKAFVKRLRDSGIDAWFDGWEILPGDSLVDKIFEEGIKNAEAFIAVVSTHSVNKPWVREELNAAVIKKINGSSKLIPVVLDDCEVPEALNSTVWVRIKDPNNYETEFEGIVKAIYERRDKPPLGTAPAWVNTIIDVIPDLTKLDCLVLKLGCEEANRKGHGMVDRDTALEKAKSLDISENECFESLQILESRAFVKIRHVHNTEILFAGFNVTWLGYEEYAKRYVDRFDLIIHSVALSIVNLAQRNSRDIAAALNKPIMLINHIVHSFEHRSWLKVIKSQTGDYNLHISNNISPHLKRMVG
jgi:hypothetical protein